MINRTFAHLSNYNLWEMSKIMVEKDSQRFLWKSWRVNFFFVFQLYLYPLLWWRMWKTITKSGNWLGPEACKVKKNLLNFGLTGKLQGPWVNLFETTIPKWKWKLKRKKCIPPFPGKDGMGRRHKFFSLFFIFWVRRDHLSTQSIVSDEKSQKLYK